MKSSQIEIKKCYQAKSELLDSLFVGQVMKKGEYSAVLKIVECGENDVSKLKALNELIVVPYRHLVQEI